MNSLASLDNTELISLTSPQAINEHILMKYSKAESFPYNLDFEELTEEKSIEIISRIIPILAQIIFEYCFDYDNEFDAENYVRNIKKHLVYNSFHVTNVFHHLNLKYNIKAQSSHFKVVIRNYYEYNENFEYFKTISREDKEMIKKDYKDFDKYRIHNEFSTEYLLIMRFKEYILGRLEDFFYIDKHPLL